MASIKKRGNSYQITVSLGYKDGKKIIRTKSIKCDPSMTEKQRDRYVSEEADKFERRVLGGADTSHDKIKFRDFATGLYMKNHCSTLKAKTRREYEIIIHDRLIPYFGDMQINNITVLDVRRWLASLERTDGSSKPLSENSKGVFFRTLSAVLGKAYEWDIISENPCKKIKTPRKAQSEVQALQIDDVKKVLESLPAYNDIRISALVSLLIFTGIREAECAGLEWHDFDFTENKVKIQREVLYIPNEGLHEDTPKSKSGTRVIYFTDTLAETLKQYKEYQTREISVRGDLWTGATGDRAKLFTQFDGTPIYDTTIRKWVKKYLKWCGVPYVTVHGLRHTYASLLISSGTDARTVASQLGHSSPALVYNTYANPQEHAKKQSARTLDNLLSS
ncbi:MAG: site-specific integrase [Saccharofermentans sp.]|nr:site-specific integrase [Saccharofermentans sp.]